MKTNDHINEFYMILFGAETFRVLGFPSSEIRTSVYSKTQTQTGFMFGSDEAALSDVQSSGWKDDPEPRQTLTSQIKSRFDLFGYF